MSIRSLVFALSLAGVTLLLPACALPVDVVAQAAPNPFQGSRRFSVLPVDMGSMQIGEKDEPSYLAEKDAGTRESFDGDKIAINTEFTNALIGAGREKGIDVVPATGPAAAPFLIRPSVRFLEPGFYAPVVSGSSEIRMNVRITAPDGRVLDEIVIHHGTPGSLAFPSSGQRWRIDARILGQVMAEYLKRRVYGE